MPRRNTQTGSSASPPSIVPSDENPETPNARSSIPPFDIDQASVTPSLVNGGTEPGTPNSFPTHSTLKRKRGRPSRAALEERRLSTPLRDDETASDIGTPAAQIGNHSTPYQPSTRGKRRGRPPAPGSKAARNRGGPSHYTQVPLDKDGNPQEVRDDEIVLAEDPAGEQKVDKNGHLQGGREYRCRTFTLLGRGEKLYMLSTEPARCIGFRDSYLFFQKHKQLFKIICDEDEKFDLIRREIIPHSYKGRAIGVVTARSVFREFGAKIIVGGRKIVDDYWEEKERAAGAVAGELADPNDKLPAKGEPYNRNQYVAWHGASSVYHTNQPSVPMQQTGQPQRKKKIVVTDTNWMLEHARAASQFNARLQTNRTPANAGVYEPHTNQMFYPAATQPTVTKWTVTPNAKPPAKRQRVINDNFVIIDNIAEISPFVGNGLGAGMNPELGTGYGEWNDELIDALETEEEKAAVRAQVEKEQKYRAIWA